MMLNNSMTISRKDDFSIFDIKYMYANLLNRPNEDILIPSEHP